ncbi:MAG: 50S ribosomal protein L30 [Alphaproteobacteria bacterium]|nr:50S ribosomal protein L30 [Alphaproteobacteria bacterium]
MTEATAKKSAAKKAAAPKAAKAAAPAKKAATGAQVKVTQVAGCIARRHDQEATLIGLGLNKRHRSRVLEDTPSVRGMIRKVRHLLVVEDVK